MDAAALEVCSEFPDIVIAIGHSDEYSFVFRRSTALYGMGCCFSHCCCCLPSSADVNETELHVRYAIKAGQRYLLLQVDESRS